MVVLTWRNEEKYAVENFLITAVKTGISSERFFYRKYT
jgi:hypothetical protein